MIFMRFAIILILTFIFNFILCDNYDNDFDNKLSFKPYELVDLVREEQLGKNSLEVKLNKPRNIPFYWSSKRTNTSIDNVNNHILMERRKLWSRWSKWGGCSVTCGDGTISRRRLCVSGRCAPGELEEQRRPCNRPPCNAVSDIFDATDDAKDIRKPSTRISSNDYVSTPDTWEGNPELKSLWVYRPASILSRQPNDVATYQIAPRPRHFITKLAKPMYYGFDPFFEKREFEPFERRQKPVTLLNFRRNGVEPYKTIHSENLDSAHVAEIQSSFNDISNFWQDIPGAR